MFLGADDPGSVTLSKCLNVGLHQRLRLKCRRELGSGEIRAPPPLHLEKALGVNPPQLSVKKCELTSVQQLVTRGDIEPRH